MRFSKSPILSLDTLSHPDAKCLVDITLLGCFRDMKVGYNGRSARATIIYPATGGSKEARTGEEYILKPIVSAIAEKEADIFDTKSLDPSIETIRRRPNPSTNGTRALCLLVLGELEPIPTLYGQEFLICWWNAVNYHLALWMNGVYHHDTVTPSNLMWSYGRERLFGVLKDFDLPTTEHVGTIPFMPIDYLSHALRGKVDRDYAQDLESFIWVLVWACLHYDEHKRCYDGPPLVEWAMVDMARCAAEKMLFLHNLKRSEVKIGTGHERNWLVALACMKPLSLACTLSSMTWDRERPSSKQSTLPTHNMLIDELLTIIRTVYKDFPRFTYDSDSDDST